MAVALPLIFFLLSGWVTHCRYRDGVIPCLLRAAIAWAVVVTASVELLSAFNILNRGWLVVTWLVLCLVLSLWRFPQLRQSLSGQVRALRSWLGPAVRLLDPSAVGIALLVTSVGLAAILSPPGPVDVHLYHMPRVLFWLQNSGVAHYPTTYYQQLFQPPFAEYALLHVYALTPGDRFVNLVQFAAYLGSALAAAGVVAEFGGRRRAQLLAAVFALTLPQGLLTASGTKNDHVVAFWIIVTLYFGLRYAQSKRFSDAVCLALAAGLALLTKGTAYVWLLSLPVTLLAARRRAGGKAIVVAMALALLAAVLLVGPYYARNMAVFGSPLGCDAAQCGPLYKFANATISPHLIGANVIRNLVLHATTPIPQLNHAVYRVGLAVLHALGVDPQDPRITWTGTQFGPAQFRTHEALAGNPLHLLIAVGLGACLVRRGTAAVAARSLLLAATVSFVVFCGVFRWQPWHARLHLPCFLLLAAFVGCAADKLLPARMTNALTFLLLLTSFPYALSNEIRPLASPGWSLFSVSREDLYPGGAQVKRLAQAIEQSGCREVALDVTGAFEIYPLLHWLGIGLGPIKLTYLTTDEKFRQWYRANPPQPCAVVYSDCSVAPWRAIQCRQLGLPATFGNLSLVMGFRARWVPDEGWQIKERATRADYPGGFVPEGVDLPATLRPEDPKQLALMAGVAGDRWVMGTGMRLAIRTRDAKRLIVTIRGDIPSWTRTLPQRITFQCADGPAVDETIARAGPFDLSATVQCPPVATTELLVQPAKAFRPRDLGINQDTRSLSFLLQEVTVAVRSP